MPSAMEQRLRERLDAVEERVRRACDRAGRRREEITLVAVTKSISGQVAAALPGLGVFDLGENRPQELWRKRQALPAGVRWHLIGHLQRNKIEHTLPVHLIHSVDSIRLLEALEAHGRAHAMSVRVLLEVNASRERAKHGFAVEELPALAPEIEALRHVEVRGLMTMAALSADAAEVRATFASVRQLAVRLRPLLPSGSLVELSMGMSNDFETAIEEGATHVRIGTTLFEGVG